MTKGVFMKANTPLQIQIRLDWSEMDLFGHINNVSYFKYAQAARVNYWDHAGITALYQKEHLGVILASTQCQFKKPLHFPGTITLSTRPEFIGNSSFGLLHQLLDESGNEVATVQDVLVMYDFNHNVKMPIPSQIRDIIGGML